MSRVSAPFLPHRVPFIGQSHKNPSEGDETVKFCNLTQEIFFFFFFWSLRFNE